MSRWTFRAVKKPYDDSISYAIIDAIRTLPANLYPALGPATTASLPWKHIERLSEMVMANKKLSNEQRLEYLEDAQKDMSTRPFLGARGCYQHLTFDDLGVGPQWTEERELSLHADSIDQLFELPEKEHLCNFSELTQEFNNVIATRVPKEGEAQPHRYNWSQSDKFVVARILGKSKVTYYGKPNKSERWAFSFSLRVVDLSGVEVNFMFWGSTVPVFYSSLEVSQIVKLSGLKLKSLYPHGPDNLSSLLTGRSYTPPFEITYNPTSANRKLIAILDGTVAQWFDSKIAKLPTSLSIAMLRDRMITADVEQSTVVKALLDGLQSKVSDAPLTSVHGLVSWVGPIEVRPHFGIRVYSRWICLIDPKEGDEQHSRGAFIQVRLGPSTEIPRALSATHIRMELHHGRMVGISTPYSEFKSWDDAQVEFAETDKELPPLAAKYDDLAPSWPFNLPFEEPKDYARICGAKLITNFVKPLPSTRPDSEDEAMDVEATPEPYELMSTQDAASQPLSTGRPLRSTFARNAKSATGSTATAKSSLPRRTRKKLGGLEAESSLRWIDRLAPQMRVDRIVACDKPFASSYLYPNEYDASKICGVLTEEEVDAIVAMGHTHAERPVKKNRRRKGSVPNDKAELFWIAFSAHPLDYEEGNRPVAEAASMPLSSYQALEDSLSQSQSQSQPTKSSRKRTASDPAKVSESRSKRRAVIKSPPLYFCAVVPISPMHFTYGNAYAFDRILEDHAGLSNSIARRYSLQASLNKKYSMLVGVSIYKHSAEDVRFTMNDVWREPRIPTPDKNLRQGLEIFVDQSSSNMTQEVL